MKPITPTPAAIGALIAAEEEQLAQAEAELRELRALRDYLAPHMTPERREQPLGAVLAELAAAELT